MSLNMKTSIILIVIICQLISTVKASACEEGYYASVAGCKICQEGNYCPGDESFYYCFPGQYTDVEGATECLTTPTNTYVSTYGATSYIECDAGYYSAEGSTSCTSCESSSIAVSDASVLGDEVFVPVQGTSFILTYSVSKTLWADTPTFVAVSAKTIGTDTSVSNSQVNGTYTIASGSSDDSLTVRLNYNYVNDVEIVLTVDCGTTHTFELAIQKCFEGCANCDTSGRYVCDSCSTEGSSTSEGEYSNDGVCDTCTTGCQTCEKALFASSITCTSCTNGYYLYGGQCGDTCPDGYYPNAEENICSGCHDWCKTCFGPTKTECTACNSPYNLLIDTCSTQTTAVGETIASVSTRVNVGVSSVSVGTSATSSVIVSSTATSTTQAAASAGATNAGATVNNLRVPGGGNIGGAQSPQLFWVMLNDYQMIETFLLLEADFHDAMISMLESINFSTVNLNWVSIPFVEDFKSEIQYWYGPNEDSLLETRLQSAGFEDNIFIADYMYFFIFLVLYLIGHGLFKVFIRVPDDPKSFIENFVVTLYKYFHFACYLRLFLESYFFMMIAVFAELHHPQRSGTAIASMTLGSIIVVMEYIFMFYVIYHYIKYRNDESIVNGPFEVLYEGLKGNDWAKLFTPFFLVRRSILAIFLVFVRVAVVQIIVMILVQLSAFLYLAIIKPFDSLEDNIINLINEAVIVFCSAFFLTLRKNINISDNEVETRTQVAIYIISISGVICFVISILFVSLMIYDLIRDYLKKRREQRERDFNDGKEDIDIDDLSNNDEESKEKPIDALERNVSLSNEA